MDIDLELYNGKTFKDLCRDICTNQSRRKTQLDAFVGDLLPLIKTPNDAMVIVPLIKQYIDAGITNDEHLVKLAQICQRLLTSQSSAEAAGGSMGLTEEEKKDLMASINEINKSDSTVVKTITQGKKDK